MRISKSMKSNKLTKNYNNRKSTTKAPTSSISLLMVEQITSTISHLEFHQMVILTPKTIRASSASKMVRQLPSMSRFTMCFKRRSTLGKPITPYLLQGNRRSYRQACRKKLINTYRPSWSREVRMRIFLLVMTMKSMMELIAHGP